MRTLVLAPAGVLALVGAVASGAAAWRSADSVFLGVIAGGALAVLGSILFARLLQVPRAAFLSAAILAIGAAPLTYALGARATFALAIVTGAWLAAREGEEEPLAPIGGPALALAATWVAPAIGLAGLVALILLEGHKLALRERASRATFASMVALGIASVGIVALPTALVGASRALRVAILVAALVANVVAAHLLRRARVGGAGRKLTAGLLALLPAAALLGVVAASGRMVPLRGGSTIALLLAAAVALLAVAIVAAATLGLVILFATENHTKPYVLATAAATLSCVALGSQALAILLVPLAISLGVFALATWRRGESPVLRSAQF